MQKEQQQRIQARQAPFTSLPKSPHEEQLTDTTPEKRKSTQKAKAEMERRRPSRFYILERAFAAMNNVFGKFLYAMFKAIREYREQYRQQAGAIPQSRPLERKEAVSKADKKKVEKKERPVHFSAPSAKAVLTHLQKTSEKLGLGKQIPPEVQIAILANEPSLHISKQTGFGPDQVKRIIVFEKNESTGKYFPVEGKATLKKQLPVDGTGIKEVNIAALEKKMRTINWEHDFMEPGIKVANDLAENKQMLARVNAVFRDMFQLKTSADPKANDIHDLLAYKFFADTPSGSLIQNMPALKDKYETTVNYDLRKPNAIHFTDGQLHALLKGNAVKPEKQQEWYQVNPVENNGVKIVQPISNRQSFQLEAALHRIGAAELLSSKDFPALKKDLENGKAIKAHVIQHGIQAERMIKANPMAGSIMIDWEESKRNRLYEPVLKQIDHFHKYQAFHAELHEKESKSKIMHLEPGDPQRAVQNQTHTR